MKVGMNDGRAVAYDERRGAWVALPGDGDLLALLADPAALGAVRLDGAPAAAPPTGLPVRPESLRAFALWEAHMINGARGLVRRFAPPPVRALVGTYERLTGGVFPALRPRANFARYPQFYVSNHRSVLADGEPVRWPAFSDVLDFELEIGVVLAREVRDCTPEAGRAAIGGLVVMNDWSARDLQWDDTRRGTFGGVVKAKTFAGAMGPVLVTADEILPRWRDLKGRVRVNGAVWCEGETRGPTFDLGEAVAYAAWGETLRPGDILSTGTLPGCCGLEMGRFVEPGDVVTLEIDGIGTLTNTVGRKGA